MNFEYLEETIVDQIQILAEELGGKMSKSTLYNDTGRSSKIITIEYDVKNLSMSLLVKGKVKTVFTTDKPEEVLIHYEDKVTAGNGKKEDYPEGKGSLCCEISKIIFKN